MLITETKYWIIKYNSKTNIHENSQFHKIVNQMILVMNNSCKSILYIDMITKED